MAAPMQRLVPPLPARVTMRAPCGIIVLQLYALKPFDLL